jgi:hypothetical protein
MAEKYGFDCEDALRELNLEEIKLVRKRGPSPKKETEKSVTKKGTKEKKPKKEEGDKPKRAKTGYLLFQDDVREEVREGMAKEVEAGEKLKPQEVVKAIAALWKELTKDDQEVWKTRAKEAATPPASEPEN